LGNKNFDMWATSNVHVGRRFWHILRLGTKHTWKQMPKHAFC